MNTPQSRRIQQRSQERRDQQKHEVRQAILDAAAALFLEHGYQGFSLRRVAEQIGYSATTIYLYFENKDDLLFTVADEGFTRFATQLLGAASTTTEPLACLRAIGHAYVQFGLENPSYYQLMFMDRADFLLGYRAGERKPRYGALDIVERTITAGMQAGVIRPGVPAIDSAALWAAVHGVVAMQIAMPMIDRARAEAIAATILQLVIDGLQKEQQP